MGGKKDTVRNGGQAIKSHKGGSGDSSGVDKASGECYRGGDRRMEEAGKERIGEAGGAVEGKVCVERNAESMVQCAGKVP